MEFEIDVQQLSVAPPVLPWAQFAEWIGMGDELDTVQAWIKRGYLPTVKIGRYRFVNVALFTKNLLEKEQEQ